MTSTLDSTQFTRDPLNQLYEQASSFGIDVEPFPSTVETNFGQILTLRDKRGDWVPTFLILRPGCSNEYIRWPQRIHKHAAIEYAIRAWVIDDLQQSSNIGHLQAVINLLSDLNVAKRNTETNATESISFWVQRHLLDAQKKRNFERYRGISNFIRWCIDEYIWGFDESLCNLLLEIPFFASDKKHRVSLLDIDDGPFSAMEMQSIVDGLRHKPIPLHWRIAAELSRTYGPRPVQLALLREEDIASDEGGFVIKIPSVKGTHRSRLRRKASNFKTWDLSPELYGQIQALISQNAEIFHKNDAFVADWAREHHVTLPPIARPLFPRSVYENIYWSQRQVKLYLENPALRDYAYHLTATTICSWFASLSTTLRIPRRSSTPRDPGSCFLRISAYRFRYTLGTRLMLDGRTKQEVAEALDHSNVASVNHYFRFNRDVFDYVCEAQLASQDIKEAALHWDGRIKNSSPNDPLEKQIIAVNPHTRRVSDIGLCGKQSRCEYKPVISCYGCNYFNPYADGNHEFAKILILEERQLFIEQSSGPLRAALDRALQGVNEVIALTTEKKD